MKNGIQIDRKRKTLTLKKKIKREKIQAQTNK